MKKILLFVFIGSICTTHFAQDAKELNSKGYSLYKEGKYEEALEYFQRSFEADPDYPYPHYNYACTIGILIGKDCCWYLDMDNLEKFGNIYYHLEKTIELKPEYREKMKTDPDLESVRHDYEFQILIGLDPEKTQDVIQILCSVEWVGPNSLGVYGRTGGIEFHPDGTLSSWSLEFTDDGYPQRKSSEGTFDVKGNSIYIHYNASDNEKSDQTGILRNGAIIMDSGYIYTDDTCDCGV